MSCCLLYYSFVRIFVHNFNYSIVFRFLYFPERLGRVKVLQWVVTFAFKMCSTS